MAKGFTKMNIKSAIKSRSQFDLDHDHLSSIDFGQLCVLNYFDGMPGDKVNYKYNIFSRVAPLNFPVYGKCSLRTVNFFVPYYQVADEIEGFFSGQKIYHGLPTSIRYTTLKDLMLLFTTNDDSSTASNPSTGLTTTAVADEDGTIKNYDFAVCTSVAPKAAFNYYKLTSRGRFVYKVLRQLGYDFPANVCTADVTSIPIKSDVYLSRKINLLPLLGYFKAYNDWMTNSVQYNSSSMTKYLEAIRTKDSTVKHGNNSPIINSDGYIDFQAIAELFSQVRMLYDSDYFTSAWRYPNNPDGLNLIGGGNTNYAQDVINVDPYNNSDSEMFVFSDKNYNQTGLNESPASSPGTPEWNLTQRQLNFLQAFDKWVRRNNYAGSRAVNQIYSRFGIKPQEFKAQYAEFISKDSVPLQIGDVTQTSQTTDTDPLGSYAGKGIANGQYGVSYDFSDYGILLTLCYVWVDPVYYRGFHRNVLNVDPLDFYNPEFDGVGPEAISMLEFWNDPKSITQFSGLTGSNNVTKFKVNDGNNVFGFTERYNSMRFQRDQITGDLELYDFFMPWHFGRDLNHVRNYGIVAQSDNVVYYTETDKGDYEYDRIFAVTQYSAKQPVEHFYLTCQFQGSASRPMRNISQAADLGDGDLVIDRLGQQIS